MRTLVVAKTFLVLLAGTAAAMSPRDVYKKAAPGVVLILGSEEKAKGSSAGTGSIVTPEGKIVTNAHVVVNPKTGRPFSRLYAYLRPPRLTGNNRRDLKNRYSVRVIAFSPDSELDLAILQMEDAPPGLVTIQFADPDLVEIGDQVVAIGHPEQGGLWTLTTGTISTLIANFGGVRGKNVFQTEASVNRGNSGGPLLDTQGNMVGINTMIARRSGDGVAITDVNFSLKSSVAVQWLTAHGMGLAYAPTDSKNVAVALAPAAEPKKTAVTKPTAPPKKPMEPIIVREAPKDTIVVAQKPPAEPERIRAQGAEVGKDKAPEEVISGDPKAAQSMKPKYLTKRRPYNRDRLIAQQMRELEDMMREMRGRVQARKKSRGLGLW